MGLMKGVADAMQDTRTRNAESDAFNSSLRAANAERAADAARQEADTLLQGVLIWKKRADELTKSNDVQTAKLAGCLIVINAVIKTMELQLSPSDREVFRSNLAQKARSRIRELDKRDSNTSDFIDLELHFTRLEVNEKLEIFPPPKPPKPVLVMPPKQPEPQKPPEVFEVNRPKFLFGTQTGFQFESKVYKTREEAVTQRDAVLQKYEHDHRLWKIQIDADELTAEQNFKNMKVAFDNWMQKHGTEELSSAL